MKKLTWLLRIVGVIQITLGLMYLFAPAFILSSMGHSAVASDIHYPLAMLASRFLAYGMAFIYISLFEKINQLNWYKKMLHSWTESQNLKPNTKVLEIGSATGELTHYLAQNNYLPLGVDRSKSMISIAKAKYQALEFQVANVYDLPFKESSFDAVIASSLINVLDDKTKALNEMIRVCSKGGIVTFLVPLKGFSDNDAERLIKKLKLRNFSKSALKMWHKSAKKMSMEEIKEMVAQSDGEILSVEYYLSEMVVGVTISL